MAVSLQAKQNMSYAETHIVDSGGQSTRLSCIGEHVIRRDAKAGAATDTVTGEKRAGTARLARQWCTTGGKGTQTIL